ncbi:hypothetical protein B0A55_03684 [Friedmanniomyces simplex]|uniref:BZIP transcription factor n=1 Tax=Friedmanniomyces simplex TaxID=329884 RepID=A0A4U0XXM1_9PEZI|nr:hypothetical protein B0A55_03684 [Friedmanniomyces simplex]
MSLPAAADDALPSINVPPPHHATTTNNPPPTSPSSSPSPAASEDETLRPTPRPKLGSRKSSGTMIVSRDHAQSTIAPTLDASDVRAMSPRRSSQEVDRLGEAARRDMLASALVLQASLQAIVDRVEEVKSEHEKLEGGNKFLQSYIGELMQTSKITSSAPKKGRGRSGK